MKINSTYEQKFKQSILSDGMLEAAIEFIRANYNPEDIFSEKELRDWANDNPEDK